MKIGVRLTLALAVPIAILIALFGLIQERVNRNRFRSEMAREGRVVARTVQLAMQYALRDRQFHDVQQLIDRITGYERVLGIRLLNPDGSLRFQSVSLREYPAVPRDILGRVVHDRKVIETHQMLGDQPVVANIVPLLDERGAVLGEVEVLELESFIEEDVRASREAIAVLTAVMVGAVAIVLFLGTRISVGAPIQELLRGFREVGSGDLRSRVPVLRNDELGRLAEAYNAMCQQLETTRRSLLVEQEERRRVEASLREAERLASIGRFAAGLAHEIGTPLNVIGGRAESLLRKKAVKVSEEKHLCVIASQIDRIARIVRGMLDFARVREPHFAPTAIPDVLGKVIELLEPRFEQKGIRLSLRVPTDLPEIAADADQLHEVFLNLAMNAADAMPDGGELRVRVECVERTRPERADARGAFMAVTFEDTGVGIADEHVGRVFDPFFTTKDIGEGTGLGLSVSYGIVTEHGGWIEIASAPGQGTRATVLLPLEIASAEPEIPFAREA